MKKRIVRLNGSSLIEVMSGLALLSLVLGLGLGLLQQLNGPLSAQELAKAQAVCRNILQQKPDEAELTQGLQQSENHHFVITREVRWYDASQDISEIIVECRWQEHLLERSVRLSRLE